MLASIPKGLYTRKQKIAIIKENAAKYRKASKKEKKVILDDLCNTLHMTRNYIAQLLRMYGREIHFNGIKFIPEVDEERIHNRGRKKIYTAELVPYLEKIWQASGFVSSKHLYYYIQYNADKLLDSEELKDLKPEDKEKLLKMSASTIERLLKPVRSKWKLRDKYKSNPFSSNVKKSIMVESYFDKQKEPGTIEVDLLYHSGESAKGEFAFTLTVTEITTDWTELRLLPNKAMKWVVEGMNDIVMSMPIPMKRIHVDNGSEFINAHMYKFCQSMGIEFRRSRPYHKNDAPYVESKNWFLVRQYTGWRRYDREEEFVILSELLRLLALRHNLFHPTMKLIGKVREGAKVKKLHDVNTPYGRVCSLPEIPEEEKEKLRALREEINPFELSMKIEELVKKLDKVYQNKVRRYNNE